MRSFAILITICAATVGTASGKNVMLLAHVQHMCDANGWRPDPTPNRTVNIVLTSTAKTGLNCTYLLVAEGLSDCLCNESHRREQDHRALVWIFCSIAKQRYLSLKASARDSGAFDGELGPESECGHN